MVVDKIINEIFMRNFSWENRLPFTSSMQKIKKTCGDCTKCLCLLKIAQYYKGINYIFGSHMV